MKLFTLDGYQRGWNAYLAGRPLPRATRWNAKYIQGYLDCRFAFGGARA